MLALSLGQVLWGLALGEVFGRLLRSSGKLAEHERPEEDGGELFVAGHPQNSRVSGSTAERNANVSFDLFGSIGLDEIIGDDDFLESLVEGGVGDDVLDDLISGDGSMEIVGAKGNAAKRKALLRKLMAKNAGAVVSRGLDRRRRYPLGFVPTAIAATATVQVPSAPQNLYRPERLVIPSDIAFDLGIVDIKVGNQSQLVQSVEVPAALFSEVAINTGVTFDTAEVGNQVSVQARNKSAAALEFTAGLVGTIAK
jgi:hypothetical protein